MGLHVALEEGFAGERTVVCVDGKIALDKSSVTTRTQIGLASTVTVDAAPGVHLVEVILPDRNLNGSWHGTIPDDGMYYLGVSIGARGEIQFRESATPFGYV